MTRLGLAGGDAEDMIKFPAPFKAAATRSSLMEKLGNPFIRWRATTEDRYDLVVEGCKFFLLMQKTVKPLK